jgi:diaminopimelate decarboxylase
MNFSYQNHELHCEQASLSVIAREVGTPFYVYSLDEIERRARAFLTAFPNALIAYAYKANANLAILRHLVSLGIGADVVSGGELWRALKVGTPPNKIVFNGNGKTAAEIAYALENEILCINVDGVEELELVAEIAQQKQKVAPIAFRLNPDIDALTHKHISTGHKASKFGVPLEDIEAVVRQAQQIASVQIVGIHSHIGSQITQPEPMRARAEFMRDLVLQMQAWGVNLQHINLGGGLGIVYRDENPMHASEWAQVVNQTFGAAHPPFILEPGRSIVAPAGALVASVTYLKRTPTKNFVVTDAGMHSLMRPALYEAYHEVRAVRPRSEAKVLADVVGPICESADFLAHDRTLPVMTRGDLIAIMDVGAYGFSMASRYNQQPLPAEVVVQGKEWRVVTQRETWEQMAEREM